MKIFRGIKDILFKDIDHLFQNSDETMLDYGPGTSYSYEEELALDYCRFPKKYAWMILAEYYPKNPLYINLSDFLDEEEPSEGFLFKTDHIAKKDLSNYASGKGHDSIVFDYDENDTHLMLLNGATTPEISEIRLYTNDSKLIIDLSNVLPYFNGEYFLISPDQTQQVDEILDQNS